MRKIWVIAARDYKAAVRTKSFLIGLLLMPVLMVGGMVVQVLLKQHVDIEDKKFAIIDRTPGAQVFALLEQSVADRNQHGLKDPKTGQQRYGKFNLEKIDPKTDRDRQRYEMSERILQGDFFGFVEIGPDVTRPGATGEGVFVRYQTNRPTFEAFPQWADKAINDAILKKRWADAHLPKDKMEAMLQQFPLLTTGLSKRDAEGNISDPPLIQQVARYLVPMGLVMLMFMVVMLGATPAMQGIVEEKMNRIAEVLLGSVRPFEMMVGKLLGLMGVSLTIAAVYLAGAYWSASRYDFVEFFPLDLLAWFAIYQILALMMYGSLFLAIGAAATDVKETQTLLMPVVLLACLPLFVLGPTLEDPNSTLSTSFSYFPFVTPMLMTARLAVPPGIPWWEPLLGILLVLATTALCVYAAGRIFRVGILMQGKGARFSDLVKWVIRG